MRRFAPRRTWAATLWLAVVLAATAAVAARGDHDAASVPVLPGRVVGVIDGDTLDVRLASGVLRVRLHAIDAPERGQPGGDAAKRALAELAFGADVDLEPIEQDRYDRQVARVWRAGEDLNAEMVRLGQAWVYRRYARNSGYCGFEAAARLARRGLWALPAEQQVAPWEWRQRKTLQGRFTDYTRTSAAECVSEQRRTAAR